MNKKAIIITVVIVAVIAIVLYFMFRKKSNTEKTTTTSTTSGLAAFDLGGIFGALKGSGATQKAKPQEENPFAFSDKFLNEE